ncbi:MAG TPA: cytochrome b/b6 domain-containing protein [Burkholderiales bacterium]|jgi:cytochrome b|nr:cytochrome b/b6 domain-containing protein [Burkholderiales bacterium]
MLPAEAPPPNEAGGQYDGVSRSIHLALALFGLAALLTGDLAGDYKRAEHSGFTIHSWIGLGMAVALGLRLAWGIVGPRDARFSRWLPVTAARLRLAVRDVAELARLRLPVPGRHEGLAAIVQAIGLVAFAWSAATGAVLYVYLEPGTRAAGWLRMVQELHEGAEPVLIAYVVLHVGAVLAHAIAGHAVWRRMAPWRVDRDKCP